MWTQDILIKEFALNNSSPYQCKQSFSKGWRQFLYKAFLECTYKHIQYIIAAKRNEVLMSQEDSIKKLKDRCAICCSNNPDGGFENPQIRGAQI